MKNKRFDNFKMLSALQDANSILLCTHLSPDGDAIGSMLTMYMALKQMGKNVVASCHDKIPQSFEFLKNSDEILLPSQVEDKVFDLAFALDAGDLQRIGHMETLFNKAKNTMQVDHHGTNPNYAEMNFVDAKAGATGCIVLRMLEAMHIDVTVDMAECLYLAISSDTGNFCYSNADDEVFYDMQVLMESGLDIAKMSKKIHLMRDRGHVALLGRALNSLHFFASDMATGMKITQKDFEIAHAMPEHSNKIVNYGLYMEGVYFAYLADEDKEGHTKFSLRALPPYNVGEIATLFGGGGHAPAAGCKIDKGIDEASQMIEEAILNQIKEKQQ